MKITTAGLDETASTEVWSPPDARSARSDRTDVNTWGTTSDLYRSSYRAMLRVAFSITGNRAAAEDAVHDAFCAVGPRIGTLDNPLPYLRVAVVNRCRSMHRSTQRAQRHNENHLAEEIDEHGLADFADALEHLTFAQRTAIVLRYQCDLSDDEIAAILKCRRSTVRSHVRRGLDNLRQELS